MDAAAHIRAESSPDGASRITTLRDGKSLQFQTIEDVVYMDFTPQSGDDLWINISIDPGATLALRGVGGFLTPADPMGLPSHLAVTAAVGKGATFDWQPQPTVSVAGSRFRSSTSIVLDQEAKLTYVEDICLGRPYEAAGGVISSLQIRRLNELLIRNTNRLGEDAEHSLTEQLSDDIRRMTTMVRSVDQPESDNPIRWKMQEFRRSAAARSRVENLQLDVSVVHRTMSKPVAQVRQN